MDVLYRKRDKRVAEHSKKLQEKAEENKKKASAGLSSKFNIVNIDDKIG